MKVVNNGKSVPSVAISSEASALLGNKWVVKILKYLLVEPNYPKAIARNFKVHEQKIYYYMRQLEERNLVEIVKKERLQGTIANYYAPTSQSYTFMLTEFEEKSPDVQKESSYLAPFVQNGQLNAQIVVGSPDPHGPQKARSRDGYFGMDMALFLGTFLNDVQSLHVRLDTEMHEKDLADLNLIIIGGPIVNKVASLVNKKSPIRFEEKSVYDSKRKKHFAQEEIGLICKFPNPFNTKKSILYVAGLRNAGTRAAITAFVTSFNQVEKLESCVVEGVDLNSDGVIDSVDFL